MLRLLVTTATLSLLVTTATPVSFLAPMKTDRGNQLAKHYCNTVNTSVPKGYGKRRINYQVLNSMSKYGLVVFKNFEGFFWILLSGCERKRRLNTSAINIANNN